MNIWQVFTVLFLLIALFVQDISSKAAKKSVKQAKIQIKKPECDCKKKGKKVEEED
jgi:Na+-transporting methylmalonyl-CoA/oxaloacetate decarboxylase gamma subunit